jgi:transposase-like protein
MRLQIRLPEVKPDEYVVPKACPYAECDGRYFAVHQQHCVKALSDQRYQAVNVKRYQCLRCRRRFRVYPTGVSAQQRSQGIGILLYGLGLSYGGVAAALAALGAQRAPRGSKSSIYRDVQAAGAWVLAMRRQQPRRCVRVLSADATYVRCRGQEVTVAVALDALAGEVIEVELLERESAQALQPWLNQLCQRFEVEVLLSDDQDSYKSVADELGVAHGICRRHVNQNVAKLVGEIAEQVLRQAPSVPAGVQSDPQQLLADLETAQLIVALRPADGAAQLARLLQRYQKAPPPAKGHTATVWYRFRLALLRWWNHWARLTLDQRWNRTHDQPLDGTNNVAERAIGWWIKQRYRTRRGYKRKASVRNVSNLTTYLAAHPDQPLLAPLLAH